MTRVDALSATIERNAVPSIEYLSRTAVRLTRVNELLDLANGPQSSTQFAAARREIIAAEEDVAAYQRLPPLPGEQPFLADFGRHVHRAAELVHQIVDTPAGPVGRAPTADEVDDAIDAAVRSVLAALEFDVKRSEDMARDVRELRASTLRMIVELDAAAALVALVAVVIAYRASRRHDQLLHEHSALLADRVAELDQFGGRVAHDVLSPLDTVATGLALLEARGTDESGRLYIDRSQRALQRVRDLVQGLLTFARSGAHPDPEGQCDVHSALSSVAADLAPAAEAKGIELVVDADDSGRVPCTPGVVASMVQNLVRNAINYIGSGPVRRVTVRSRRSASVVRIEVEDTGPGIRPELQTAIFQPFVRGEHGSVAGTGLGLATVKRLVESHDGSIGVRSRVGHGSVFWIELPAAVREVEATR